MRFYTPAKKCKLDSPWIGPYLVVSFIGWTIGIQKAPESPIVLVHCQDIKKIPPPPGAVSWLTTKKLSSAPSVRILGASTMQRTLPSPLSLTVAPPAKGTLIAEAESNHSVSSSVDPSIQSGVDVKSAPLIYVPLRVEGQIVGIDSSCVIHPFYTHKMDSGPVRLMTIAHALSGTVQKSGNMFFKGCKYFMGATVCGDVSDRFNFDGRGAIICVENEGIYGESN